MEIGRALRRSRWPLGFQGSILTALLLTAGVCVAQPVVYESAKLVPSDADSVATAGWAVGATADLVAVGAFRDATAGPQTGAAYVFRFDGASWREEAKFVASDAQSYGSFGRSIDATRSSSGDAILVGAPGSGDYGAAYVFRHITGNKWLEESKLVPDPSESNPSFGLSVAMVDDLALVYTGANDFGETSGAVVVFSRNGQSWNQEARLLASDGAEHQLFGRSLNVIGPIDAIGGGHLAIFGALGDATLGHQTGAAYIFRREPDGSWIEEEKLMAPDAQSHHGFGWSVAIMQSHFGDILAFAGAPTDDDVAFVAGATYVFRRETGGEWIFEAKLLSATGDIGHRAGYSAAAAAPSTVAADAIVITGAPAATSWTGRALLFQRTLNNGQPTWSEAGILLASDAATGNELGRVVAASETMVVAGAPYNDTQGGPAGRGAAYTWDLTHAVSMEPLESNAHVELRASVYPNPTRGQFSLVIETELSTSVALEVFDALGRLIFRSNTFAFGPGHFELPIRQLHAGTYYLRLVTSTGVKVLSVTVIN